MKPRYVYGSAKKTCWSIERYGQDVYRARVGDVEKIPLDCDHVGEPSIKLKELEPGSTEQIGVVGYKCRICGEPLEPTGWKKKIK